MRMKAVVVLLLSGIAGACAKPQGAGTGTVAGPLSSPDLPKLSGQAATCAGPRERAFTLEAREVTVDLGMGLRFNAWTYNGQLPGPTLEACEGDRIKITVKNHASTSHGLDSHALRTDTMQFGPVPPDGSMTIDKTVDTPGVFMYHCASGPVTDIHIKSGIHGAMIVYPRKEQLRPAREIVVVEDAIYGVRDDEGFIPGTDPKMAQKNEQAFSMFNGRMDNDAVRVNPGDLVRMYFVNVGPGVSSAHVIGTVLDRVYDGKDPIYGVQTYAIPSGSGAMLEFYIPEEGVYPFVDHDKLAFLSYGLALPFATPGVPAMGH